nr:hypothetical protein [Actinomycetota bacterium]
ERSTILGKPPNVAAGGAFAAAAVMIIAGVVVLTYVRQAAKAMEPAGSAPGATIRAATGSSLPSPVTP